MKFGKRYSEALKLIEKGKLYSVDEALDLAVKTASAKFDETIELHVRLGVDSKTLPKCPQQYLGPIKEINCCL